MKLEKQEAIIEGILFAMGESVEVPKLAEALGISQEEVRDILQKMRQRYQSEERGIEIIEMEGAVQMCTKKEIYEYLVKVAKQPKRHVLTDVLLETLSIIAYKQPITRLEVEKIRGVSCAHAVNKLVEYNLVQEVGRLDAPGRPALFATTEEFLRRFGIGSREELPDMDPVRAEEIRSEVEEELNIHMENEEST